MGNTTELRIVGGAFIHFVPSLKRNVKLRRVSWLPPLKDLSVNLHPYGSVSVGLPAKNGQRLTIIQGRGRPQAMASPSDSTELLMQMITLVHTVVRASLEDIDAGRIRPSILLDRSDLVVALDELEQARQTPIHLK